MPAFLITAGVMLGSQLWSNHKRKKAAEEAEALLADQVDAREGLIDDAQAGLEQTLIDYEEGKLPIPKQEVEKGTVGTGYADALETASSDRIADLVAKDVDDNLAQTANIRDPRIKQAVMSKAVKEGQKAINKAANEQLSNVAKAETALGGAETQVNRDFANAKNQAESQYASLAAQYVQNQMNHYQGILTDQQENIFDAEYQGGMMVPFAQAQNAADFANTASQLAGTGYTHYSAEKGGSLEALAKQKAAGGNMSYYDQFQDVLGSNSQGSALSGLTAEQMMYAAEGYKQKREERQKERRLDEMRSYQDEYEREMASQEEGLSIGDIMEQEEKSKPMSSTAGSGMNAIEKELDILDEFKVMRRNGGSLREGGVTRGEFNHGDVEDPMSGNDQVLIDQEDLIQGLESGEIKSYEDIENRDMIQAITTGQEGILDDKNFADNLSLVDAANPNSPVKVEDIKFKDGLTAEKAMNDVLLAKDGARLFSTGGTNTKKKTQEDIQKAQMLLAAYMKHLYNEPQFRA